MPEWSVSKLFIPAPATDGKNNKSRLAPMKSSDLYRSLRGEVAIIHGSKYLRSIVNSASQIADASEIISRLGISDLEEKTYIVYLIGKELIADHQARRRDSDSPEKALSDRSLIGLGLVAKKQIKKEELFNRIVDHTGRTTAKISGVERTEMIKKAIHNLFSIFLYETRKTVKTPSLFKRIIRKNHMTLLPIDLPENEIDYWRQQIANHPRPQPKT